MTALYAAMEFGERTLSRGAGDWSLDISFNANTNEIGLTSDISRFMSTALLLAKSE
jgi:hypothetical protein